jgi:hypothetical protein
MTGDRGQYISSLPTDLRGPMALPPLLAIWPQINTVGERGKGS